MTQREETIKKLKEILEMADKCDIRSAEQVRQCLLSVINRIAWLAAELEKF